MSEKDEYELKLEELLPCICSKQKELTAEQIDSCPAFYREVVAAEFREQAEKHRAHLAQVRSLNRLAVNVGHERIVKLEAELASLRAENEQIKTVEFPRRIGKITKALKAKIDDLRAHLGQAEKALALRCACQGFAGAKPPAIECGYHQALRGGLAAAKIAGMEHVLSLVARFEVPGDQIFDAIQSLIEEAKAGK